MFNAVKQTISRHISVAYDRFRVHYGFKGRDEVQIRLEKDGKVYLSYTEVEGQRHYDVVLTEQEFLSHFKAMVQRALSDRAARHDTAIAELFDSNEIDAEDREAYELL